MLQKLLKTAIQYTIGKQNITKITTNFTIKGGRNANKVVLKGCV